VSAILSAARVVPMAKAALWAIAACAVCSAASFGGGVWVGIEWHQGRQAQQDAKGLRAEVADLSQATGALRQRALDVAQDFRTASMRLEFITQGHEHDRTAIESFFARQRAANEHWLATRLDLYGCRIGADGMRAWNDASAGTAADPTAGSAADAAHAVPALAPAAHRGPRPSADAQSLDGGGAVPPVPVLEGSRDGGAGIL
jgi:hypothetical protein